MKTYVRILDSIINVIIKLTSKYYGYGKRYPPNCVFLQELVYMCGNNLYRFIFIAYNAFMYVLKQSNGSKKQMNTLPFKPTLKCFKSSLLIILQHHMELLRLEAWCYRDGAEKTKLNFVTKQFRSVTSYTAPITRSLDAWVKRGQRRNCGTVYWLIQTQLKEKTTRLKEKFCITRSWEISRGKR